MFEATGISKEAYVKFITESKEMLYRIAFGYLHDEATAMDAVDEAIYLGYVHNRSLREPKFLKTWVTRILINECHKILRKNKREFTMEIMPEAVSSDDENIQLKLLIDNLPEELRKIIILRYFGGYTISETAEILEIPVGTVSTRTKRALEILKVEVSD